MAVYSVIGIGDKKKYFDVNAYRDAIYYIARPDHACYTGFANLTSMENAAAEMQQNAAAFGKDKGKRIRHSVLSFDHETENVSAELADQFAQEIIQYYAPEYQITYAVHNNTEDIHIHFVMNMVGLDGEKYGGKRKDYYDFQKYMRQVTNMKVMNIKESRHPQ